MSERDHLRRFTFEDLGVRGELVRLDSSWQTVLLNHEYPSVVRAQLGQALAAAVLLSATIKFRGSLILQAQSEGPLYTLVAQATHQRNLRGLAHWREPLPAGGSLAEIFGAGRLVLTIQNEGSEPYQGIVPLEGSKLAEALQTYFTLSEQLQTKLWLAADGNRAAGLLLQELPDKMGSREDWDRIGFLADTVTDGELLNLPGEDLLFRLFNEEKVRLFEPEAVSFRCTCSRERIEATLRGLGTEEMEDILKERDVVEVTCEFCNRRYAFDRVDIHALFAPSPAQAARTRH